MDLFSLKTDLNQSKGYMYMPGLFTGPAVVLKRFYDDFQNQWLNKK